MIFSIIALPAKISLAVDLFYTLYSHFAFNWLWANPVTSMLCKPSFYDLRHQIDFTSKSSNFLLKIYYLWEKRISNPILSQHHIGPPLHLPLSFFVKGKVSSTYLHFLQGVQFENSLYGFSNTAICFEHFSIRTPCIRDLGFFA